MSATASKARDDAFELTVFLSRSLSPRHLVLSGRRDYILLGRPVAREIIIWREKVKTSTLYSFLALLGKSILQTARTYSRKYILFKRCIQFMYKSPLWPMFHLTLTCATYACKSLVSVDKGNSFSMLLNRLFFTFFSDKIESILYVWSNIDLHYLLFQFCMRIQCFSFKLFLSTLREIRIIKTIDFSYNICTYPTIKCASLNVDSCYLELNKQISKFLTTL